jgi:signal transduction histidine kinase
VADLKARGRRLPRRLIANSLSSQNVAPIVVIVIALVGSVAVPARQTWLISRLLHQTTETLSPARLLASQLHAGLAEELALLRVPGTTMDDASLAQFRALADSDDQRMARIATLAGRFDAASDRAIAALGDAVSAWRQASRDAERGIRLREQEGEAPMRTLVAAHRAALAAVSDVSAALSDQATARDQRMGELDRTGLGWNIVLVIAALAALTAVAVLMARERQSLATTRAQARREAALREAAESFAAAFTLEEIQRCVTEAAVAVFEARVARIEPAAPDRPNAAPRVTHSSDGEVASLIIPLSDDSAGEELVVVAPARAGRSTEAIAYAAVFGHLASLAIEKVRILDDARRGRDRLERVLKSRSRLIRGFSHDVKNPIGAADGYAALLSEGIYGELSAPQRESLQRIRRSIQVALTLIHDLHELAAAETGHLAMEEQAVEVGALVAALVDEYQAAARAAGLELRALVDDAVATISTSEIRVRQIVSNLISNAIKYADRGTVTVHAGGAAKGPGDQPGSWTRIDVIDEGPGIPLDKQEFIFEEFGRIAPSGKSGAGLGLAISRLIAQALGGQLTVESAPGSGSKFTLWLPARRARDARAAAPGEHSEPLSFRLARGATDRADPRPHRIEEEGQRDGL